MTVNYSFKVMQSLTVCNALVCQFVKNRIQDGLTTEEAHFKAFEALVVGSASLENQYLRAAEKLPASERKI